ncbi:MAG TPA: FkbM family methyltransferase [Casimicrobiaceae bacterium]|nr:FkbM family methyltransferase [Casimicrobiaceae bacterium]
MSSERSRTGPVAADAAFANIEDTRTGRQEEAADPLATIASAVYNVLLKTQALEKHRVSHAAWKGLWNASRRHFRGPVRTVIHGHEVVVNFGYAYPYLARRFPLYNQPLLELVHQSFRAKGSPIGFVDVGAAVGDTVLLVDANCPGMIARYHCIDGDPEFFGYMKKNLGSRADVKLYFALLSSAQGEERELVRIHSGTASAQGAQRTGAVTLDALLSGPDCEIDVLKIDVDGFDGRVLAGSRAILERQKPSVIFEWHPILCQQTGNSAYEHFEVLADMGYATFAWFTKLGAFSHFTRSFDRKVIGDMAELCLRNRHGEDWHYDVAAVHASSKVDTLGLAELAFARGRRSRC